MAPGSLHKFHAPSAAHELLAELIPHLLAHVHVHGMYAQTNSIVT